MNAALFPDLIVNGEKVPHTLVAAETQNHEAPVGKPGVAWRKAANAVALRVLLLQEASARGLSATPQELEPGRFETEQEALIRGLLDLEISVEPPTEAEVQAEWAKDPSRFKTQPLWEVSHILCACDPRDATASETAKLRATELAKRAQQSPKGFASLAAQESDCGSKQSGGALGQLSPGDTVPEFEAVLRDMHSGEMTPTPVLTRYGWHIIRMDDVAQGTELPFGAVQAKISEAMEKAAWATQARAFVGKLVDAADITGAELKTANWRDLM